MRVAVIGASGVLARNVVPRLLALGHEVNGLVNRPESMARARALGAEPFAGDLFAPATLAPALAGCSAVLNLATSVPRPGTPIPITAATRACAAKGRPSSLPPAKRPTCAR